MYIFICIYIYIYMCIFIYLIHNTSSDTRVAHFGEIPHLLNKVAAHNRVFRIREGEHLLHHRSVSGYLQCVAVCCGVLRCVAG